MAFEIHFGEKIREAREDADLLQSDMARLIPMNQSNYSKIERELQEPSLFQFRRICQILHLDPRYLLNLDENGQESTYVITPRQRSLLEDAEALIEKYKQNKDGTN